MLRFCFFFSFAFSLEDPWLGLLEEVGAAKCLVAREEVARLKQWLHVCQLVLENCISWWN